MVKGGDFLYVSIDSRSSRLLSSNILNASMNDSLSIPSVVMRCLHFSACSRSISCFSLRRSQEVFFMGTVYNIHMRARRQNDSAEAAVSAVLSHHREHARSFPWRETGDPYCILVSEYMLQQTQTDRVVPKYESFLRSFPTVRSLAEAKRQSVLIHWSGLGYNRRAVALHEAAKAIVSRYGGEVPAVREELLSLPGVGPYTAGAVLVFAYNMPVPVVETNIRTVAMHYGIRKKHDVGDDAVMRFVRRMLDRALDRSVSARMFFSACMDYGAYLKRTGLRINRRSRHHVRQGTFSGSVRRARGELLRRIIHSSSGVTDGEIEKITLEKKREALLGLVRDGIIEKRCSRYYSAD